MKKRCTKCGLEKIISQIPSRSEFYKNRCFRDGYHYVCKACYRLTVNPAKRLAMLRRWRLNHRAQYLAIGRRWRERNRAYQKEYRRKYKSLGLTKAAYIAKFGHDAE